MQREPEQEQFAKLLPLPPKCTGVKQKEVKWRGDQ